jgi:hypothetical protein
MLIYRRSEFEHIRDIVCTVHSKSEYINNKLFNFKLTNFIYVIL